MVGQWSDQFCWSCRNCGANAMGTKADVMRASCNHVCPLEPQPSCGPGPLQEADGPLVTEGTPSPPAEKGVSRPLTCAKCEKPIDRDELYYNFGHCGDCWRREMGAEHNPSR